MVFFDPQIILFLQTVLPYIAWEILNLFGGQIVYVMLLGVAFWCLNKHEGKIAVMLVMFSSFINIFLKYVFGMPRPPVGLRQNPDYAADQSYGLPSGATQTATTFWGWAAIKFRRWAVYLVAIILITTTALARMGLGMHFLGDVIGGIIIGIIMVIWAYFLVPYIQTHWKRMPTFFQNWLLPLISLIFFIIYSAFYLLGLPYFPSENIAVSMGVVFGFSVGLVLEKRYVNFKTEVQKNTKILRAMIGILLALIVYYALAMLFSLLPTFPLIEFTARYLRYSTVGFFGSFIIPFLFNYIEQRGVRVQIT